MQAAEHALGNLGHAGIVVVGLMKERVGILKRSVTEMVETCWGQLVGSGKDRDGVVGWVRVLKEVQTPEGVVVKGEMVVEALEALGLLKGKVDGLHQMIDRVLIGPRLEVPKGGRGDVPAIVVDEGESKIRNEGKSRDLSAGRLTLSAMLKNWNVYIDASSTSTPLRRPPYDNNVLTHPPSIFPTEALF